ncbi:undecaprenyl-diphosphate phosphatase [Candidatus Pacearchaeota archaeon]|nr:MAG: undecaprenyl-diphosphate phosphatase [Candidatus Pacearchaeota archaeon]
MLAEILLSIIQSATEFLPVSSSGHLALFSNLASKPDIFFFTVLHLASLFAVLVFTRKEVIELLSFKKSARPIWLYLILATIPAAIFGFFFKDLIEKTFSSYLFLSLAFAFTSLILFLTKFAKKNSTLNAKNSLLIGIFQVLALFPGVSRSGMTISSAMFLGIEKERAAKFSFLLLIPLVLGAVILEFGKAYFSISLVISFIITFLASILFLNLLMKIILKNRFWLFGFYTLALSIISFLLYLKG